jgi:hypothetical protein
MAISRSKRPYFTFIKLNVQNYYFVCPDLEFLGAGMMRVSELKDKNPLQNVFS